MDSTILFLLIVIFTIVGYRIGKPYKTRLRPYLSLIYTGVLLFWFALLAFTLKIYTWPLLIAIPCIWIIKLKRKNDKRNTK